MAFQSILAIDDTSLAEIDTLGEPACLADLNLDQLVAPALVGREEYGRQGFFYRPLAEGDAAIYRQEVSQTSTRAP